jgi:polysaccharide biosynthesis/export protein
MSTLTQQPRPVAAAGLLFLLLFAFTPPSGAEQPKVAKLTPIASKMTTSVTTPITASADVAATPSGDLRLDTLGMGDMIRVNVFRNPELTTEAKISEKGTVLFPLIGEIPVAGLTPSQAGQRVSDRLRQGKYVVNPEVTVSLVQINSRQVSVLGSVQKPGRYPLDSTTGKLTDLLALAGGIAPGGSEQITLVTTRNGQTVKQDIDLGAMLRTGDLAKNVELKPGDTIYVSRAPQVYVYGEVQKGGAYPIAKDTTVMQALALGGGLTPRGTTRGVQIHRRNGDQVHQMTAKLTDIVQPDDVIYVKESLF